MPVTINGTTGIAGVDGSASTPSVQGSDTNTGEFFPAADTIAWTTGGSERMRVDSSGNVGIGTNSPSQKLDVRGGNGTGGISGSGGTWAAQIIMNQDAAGYGGLSVQNRYANTNTTVFEVAAGWNGSATGYYPLFTINGQGECIWKKNTGGEYARIDSNGNLLVGVTSGGSYNGSNAVAAKAYVSRSGFSGSFTPNVFNTYWTGSAAQLYVDNSNLGTIAFTSDYRIKRNISTQTESGIDRIMKLRPVSYQIADYKDLFKATDDIKEGFIAHEMQEVIPSAVEGEKDAEDKIQSLRLDALCSVLVKAVQELSAKVDAQAAEIAALKAKVPA